MTPTSFDLLSLTLSFFNVSEQWYGEEPYAIVFVSMRDVVSLCLLTFI